MSEGRVYQRDASWYAHSKGGPGGRYHWPHLTRDGFSACGRVVIMDDEAGTRPEDVPGVLRCAAPGCSVRYREVLGR